MTQGAPGRTSWASAMPASTSTVCCTSAAGTDTGAIAPMSRKGVTITRLPGLGVGDQPLEHAHVVAKRRVDVDVGEDHRVAVEAAVHDLDHADAVVAPRPPTTARRPTRGRSGGSAASARSRWRESSGTSLGSSMFRPGVSSASVICVSRMSCSRSAIVPSRRSPSIRTNGGPCTGQKIMLSPPISRSRAGFRARIENSSRRERGLRAQEGGVEADRVSVDRLARLAEELERAGMVELHADLGGEPLDALVERRQRVLRQWLEPGPRVQDHERSVYRRRARRPAIAWRRHLSVDRNDIRRTP